MAQQAKLFRTRAYTCGCQSQNLQCVHTHICFGFYNTFFKRMFITPYTHAHPQSHFIRLLTVCSQHLGWPYYCTVGTVTFFFRAKLQKSVLCPSFTHENGLCHQEKKIEKEKKKIIIILILIIIVTCIVIVTMLQGRSSKNIVFSLYHSAFSCPTTHFLSAVSHNVLCNEWESSPDLTVVFQ